MAQSVQRGTKTIRLPISELEYSQFLTDRNHAHDIIRDCIQKFPELLPKDIIAGYHFCGFTEASKKIADFRQRRIKLVGNGLSYIIAPGFVIPYMMGKVDELDKGMVLVGAGTPCDITSYVCGRNESFWHRCSNMFGRCSIVGTTVRHEENLPDDIVADEKHTKILGEKAYIPTIAGDNCLLGADITMNANTEDLTAGYGVFKDEARNLKSDYSPKTANTDGWGATENAMKKIFPKMILILCYLHSFIKVRDCCRKNVDLSKSRRKTSSFRWRM